MTTGRTRILGLTLCCAAAAAAAAPAEAAEGANFNPIGYSADGRHFAYEQYGVQDPSGYPYWDVTVIDTANNRMAPASPAAVVVEDNTRTVLEAHDRVAKQAAALLKANGIVEPYALLAANPNTQVVADRRSVTFERWYNSGGATAGLPAFADLRFELRVDDSTVPKPGNCDPSEGSYTGVSLKIRDFAKKEWKTLYTDDGLPVSRGCALSYDLAAVVGRTAVSSDDWLVAIIGVYSPGFQGMDHHYFAVPFQLPH